MEIALAFIWVLAKSLPLEIVLAQNWGDIFNDPFIRRQNCKSLTFCIYCRLLKNCSFRKESATNWQSRVNCGWLKTQRSASQNSTSQNDSTVKQFWPRWSKLIENFAKAILTNDQNLPKSWLKRFLELNMKLDKFLDHLHYITFDKQY